MGQAALDRDITVASPPLKSKLNLLFGVIALGGFVFIVSQRREIGSLRAEASEWEAKLATRPHPRVSAPESVANAAPPKEKEADAVSGSGIDWKTAVMISRGELSNADAILFRRQVEALSLDEVVAAVDELEASDMPERTKMNLSYRFLLKLSKADPRSALERFEKYADEDPNIGNLLVVAMESWVKQDSGAALAWLDRWVAANPVYDNALSRISSGRVKFESVVIKTMLSEKPDVLVERISAMPREEAVNMCSSIDWERSKTTDPFAFAELVRQSLSKDDRDLVLKSKAGMVAQYGLDKASEFLDRIHVQPDELKVCLETVVKTRMERDASDPDLGKEIKTMRDWVAARDAGQADTLTGAAFGHALQGRDLDFDEVAPVVMTFQQSAGNDEVLHAFLKNGGCCHGSKSLELAAKISDPAVREEVVRHIKNHR